MVEKASGLNCAEFLRKNIFNSLGMSGTIAYEQGVSIVKRRAYGYTKSGNGFRRNDQSLTSSVLGDGGIYSSIEDLYKWDQALYTSKLVDSEAIARAFTAGVATEREGVSYGFGWFVENYRGLRTVWHYGSTVGFRTAIERFPEQHFTVIVLVNRDRVDAHELARRVVDLYLFGAK